MIIRCIETLYHPYTSETLLLLVKGKDYEVMDMDANWFLVIGENGKRNWFSKSTFETFDVIRDRKLNLLLDDMGTIC